jgi:hypothetical protein
MPREYSLEKTRNIGVIADPSATSGWANNFTLII